MYNTHMLFTWKVYISFIDNYTMQLLPFNLVESITEIYLNISLPNGILC